MKDIKYTSLGNKNLYISSTKNKKGIKHKEVSLEQAYNIQKDLKPCNLKFYRK